MTDLSDRNLIVNEKNRHEMKVMMSLSLPCPNAVLVEDLNEIQSA